MLNKFTSQQLVAQWYWQQGAVGNKSRIFFNQSKDFTQSCWLKSVLESGVGGG
jgi:hypothetical protein